MTYDLLHVIRDRVIPDSLTPRADPFLPSWGDMHNRIGSLHHQIDHELYELYHNGRTFYWIKKKNTTAPVTVRCVYRFTLVWTQLCHVGPTFNDSDGRKPSNGRCQLCKDIVR